MLTAAQGGTCAIIKVECCVYVPDLSGNVSAALGDIKNQVKAMSNENIPFWTLILSWVKGDWRKTIFTIVTSCLYNSPLWILHFTMYYELCNPKVGVVLPNWWSESQGAIYPYEWCSYYELKHQQGGLKEEIVRTGSILKAGLHLRLDCRLWAISPGSMETTYQLEYQTPPPPSREESQGSYIDSPLPKRIS